VERRHRRRQREVGGVAVLDQLEDERRRAELQQRRDLAQVRVADDHVQPAVLLGVGVRLVARVDDRALQGGFETDLGLEEVRALRHLVTVPRPLVPRGLPAQLAGTAEDLTAHEERGEPCDQVAERHLPVDKVVLVGAVRVALPVAVVLVHGEPLRARHRALDLLEGPLEHPLPRLVVDHEVARRHALGRGVLGVRVVDVVAGPVGQDHVRETQVLLGGFAQLDGLEPAGIAER
jgi:hypothetical protein